MAALATSLKSLEAFGVLWRMSSNKRHLHECEQLWVSENKSYTESNLQRLFLFHSVLDLYFDNDHQLNQLFYFEQNDTLLLVLAVLSYFSISSSIFSKPGSV